MINLRKYFWIFALLIIIIETIALYSLINKYKDSEYSNQLYKQRITNLTNKLDSQVNIIDTIYLNIDNTKIKIQYLEKEYDKTSQIIFNESVDSDMLYFSNYLSTTFE